MLYDFCCGRADLWLSGTPDTIGVALLSSTLLACVLTGLNLVFCQMLTCKFYVAICCILVLFPISILHVSSHNIFLALQSLAPLAFAYTGVRELSSHVEVQCLRLLRLTKPALTHYQPLG